MAFLQNPFRNVWNTASDEISTGDYYRNNYFPYTPVLDFTTCGYLAPTDKTAQKGKTEETIAEQNGKKQQNTSWTPVYAQEPLSESLIRPVPKRILKSGNRTIVFWQDGTKTIVKRADDEADSDYAAFTAALAIKLYGSNSAVKRIVDKTETQKPKKQKEAQKDERTAVEKAVDELFNALWSGNKQ